MKYYIKYSFKKDKNVKFTNFNQLEYIKIYDFEDKKFNSNYI